MEEQQSRSTQSTLSVALRNLTKGLGVQRADLLEALQGDLGVLRECWHVNVNNGLRVARATVAANLNEHIRKLRPRPAKQQLSARDREKQYRYAIQICFNTVVREELKDSRGRDLTRRQQWLAEDVRGKLKIDESTCRRDLADAIQKIEQQILASEYEPIHTVPEHAEAIHGHARQPEQILIERGEYLDRLRQHLNAGRRIVCIWGEPGTGKTTLAQQLALSFKSPTSALLIRAGDDKTFRRDLIEALITQGPQPAHLDLDYLMSMFKRWIAERSGNGIVIIDNVNDEYDLWQLIPRQQPDFPIIVTMRTRPRDELLACEELYDFTVSQARAFIEGHLHNQDKQEVIALARVLGYRPLALEHAVLFVKETHDVELLDLIRLYAKDTSEALSVVTPSDQQERNLIKLYKAILASLAEYIPALVLLDSFLAVASKGAVENGELVYHFMQSEYGGSHNWASFRGGLRELTRRGVMRQFDQSATRQELAMHPLTYRIIHDLRGIAPLELGAKYWQFLCETDHLASEDKRSISGRVAASLLQWSSNVMRDVLPSGWIAFNCIGEETWTALLESDADDVSQEPYAIRFELSPAHGIQKLDYRTGKRSDLNAQESRWILYLICVYAERVTPEMRRLEVVTAPGFEGDPDDEQTWIGTGFARTLLGRLDADASAPDEYRHSIIDPLRFQDCIKLNYEVWSLCGKRFVPNPTATAQACPDCERMAGSAVRLQEIDLDIQRFFAHLDFERPEYSAYLYLVRAKIRLELGWLEEAARDLTAAFNFLAFWTEIADPERFLLGEGILRVALAHRNSSPRWAIGICDWLLRVTSEIDLLAKARLLLNRAKLLYRVERIQESLADYKEALSLASSSDIGLAAVDMFKIFCGKEQAERRLGLIDDANTTMRHLIAEAERLGDDNLLIECLCRSGRYLTSARRPELARDDLTRAVGIARTHEQDDWKLMYRCLFELTWAQWGCGNRQSALQAAEEALRIAEAQETASPIFREAASHAVAQIKKAGATGSL